MDGPATSVARRTIDAEASFHDLITRLGPGSRCSTDTISVDAAADVRDRFKLWAGNIGARHPPKSTLSLESRLATAKELLEQVLDLLDDLIVALDDLSQIVAGNKDNRLITNQASITLNEGGDGSNHPIIEKDEASDILDVVSECIRSLLKISILIRKATPRDRFAKALDSPESPFMDQFDIGYVTERYPKLSRPGSRWLCERLGRAITKRRQFLRYTRERGTYIAGGPKGGEPGDDSSLAALDKDNATDLPASTPSAIGTGLAAMTMAPTRPSTVASTLDIAKLEALRGDGAADDDARSYVSAGSSFQEGAGVDNCLRLPSLADLRGNNSSAEFECPFCRGIQIFTREWAWRRHAYADLRAYTCTLGKDECDLTFFADSRAWFDHETTTHRRQWMCILCRNGPFRTQASLETHARRAHAAVLLDIPQMEMLASAGQTAVDAIPAEDCPFCDEWATLLKSQMPVPSAVTDRDVVVTVEPRLFRRHVALHMEQLALFAIPRTAGDDGSDDGDSQSAANRRATSSRDIESVVGDQWHPDPPLHVAVAHGHLDEIRRLLNEGADIHSKGETWGTALNAARNLGKHDIEELLIQHGAEDEADRVHAEQEVRRPSGFETPRERRISATFKSSPNDDTMLQELKAERAAAGEKPEDTPSKSEPSETSRVHTVERGVFEAAGPTPPAFWLVPDNENAKRVTTEPKNQYYSSALQNGLSGLYLSFADETKQEITLGRSGTDIYLPDPQGSCKISKLHCSFVNRTNRGAILLVDRSTNANTEPYSSNKGGLISLTIPFSNGKRSVLVARGINTNVAFGKDKYYQFQIYWQSDGLYDFPNKDEPYNVGPPQRRKKYLKGDYVGGGTYGILWRALDVTNGELIAVKTMHHVSGKNLVFAKREVENLVKINRSSIPHSHIIEILGSSGGNPGDTFFEIMMSLKEGDLETLAKAKPTSDFSHPVLHQMLSALKCLAEHNIVHRDVNPVNILYEFNSSGGYHFRLGGFGLSTDQAKARSLCGTEPFIAPEVLHRRKQTEKVDIWSLFATIVWLRDIDNFRRNCSMRSVSQIQEWLVALSGRESLKDIKAMANLKPSQRPSAKDLLKSLSKIPTSRYDAAEDEKDGVASSSGLASNYNDGDDAKGQYTSL